MSVQEMAFLIKKREITSAVGAEMILHLRIKLG